MSAAQWFEPGTKAPPDPSATGTVPDPAGSGALIVLAVCAPLHGLLSTRACVQRYRAANGLGKIEGAPAGIKRSQCRGCPAGEGRMRALKDKG